MGRITTKDQSGAPNGWLLPVWNIHDGPQISQVYVTAIAPGMSKGPHLHMKRRGLFCRLTGAVLLATRDLEGNYTTHDITEPVLVPSGTPAALYNIGTTEALVLNMPHPAWRQDDQDEWPVEGWNYTP